MPSFGPISSAPVSSLADPPASGEHYDLDLFDYILVAFEFGAKFSVELNDAFSVTDAITEQRLYNLRSRLAVVDAVTNQATLVGNLTSGATVVDAIRMAWWMLLEDAGDAADSASYRITKGVALTDALRATATVDGRLTAYAACAVAVTLEDAIRSGWSKDLADQAAITDAVQNTLSAMLALSDSIALSDSAVGSLRLSLVCAETVNVDDDLATTLRMNADLADGVLLYCSFRLGDTEYSGWAVNTDLRAATEHRNQPFDSIVSHPKGFHYAAGPGGIVQITGKDDDGAPIDAYLRTFLTDFGTHKFKRVPDIFVGLATDGRMLVKMVTRDPRTGVACDDWYELVTKQDAGEAQGRAKIGRGLKSTWWGMELRNIQGADFRLDEIAWRALILDRRQ